MDSLDREQARLAAEEDATLEKLLRLRKQQRFLQSRRSRMIREGFESLEELERAEAVAPSRDPVDPENAKEERSPKRLRGDSAANIGVGPAAPPESSEPVNRAWAVSPFNFEAFLLSEVPVWDVQSFDGGILQ